MFYLIETLEQLNNIHLDQLDEIFLEVIPYNPYDHPSQNKICCLYLKFTRFNNKGYLIAISHEEAFPIEVKHVYDVIMPINKIFVRDKKEVLHYFPFSQLVDVNLEYPPTKTEYTFVHNWFYRKFPNKKDINKIIPISKHYEYCENMFDSIKDRINNKVNSFYNNKASIVFGSIERNGIKINKNKFSKFFYKEENNKVYTQYNFKTLTTRPSNHFKGINFGALNKKNGERECFIPENDIFIEFDISAYHPSLISKLIGYDFGGKDIHQEFAKMYGVSYEESKKITFQQLYGGVFKQYQHLEYFQKVKKFIKNLWENFNNKGYIEDPISHHKFYKEKLENENMNPQKLLNYYLQRLETSQNILILWDILKFLREKNTKLILYTYDSFLLDWDKTELILEEIKSVFKKYNLRVKSTQGINYGNMTKI